MFENIYYYIKTKKFLLHKRNQKLWGGDTFEIEIRNSFNAFLTKKELDNKSLISKMTYDIALSYVKYGALTQEYFLFDFRNLDSTRRGEFLTNKEKDNSLLALVSYEYYRETLRDKYKFYKIFHPFFHREICKVVDKSDFKSFESFAVKHPTFFLKPIDSMCGIGAQSLSIVGSSAYESFNQLLNLKSNSGWILEELIQPCDEFSRWNKSSINTVRIPSFMCNNQVHILKPFFRVGRSGMEVDNAACGGLFSVIDVELGILLTDGNDERGLKYQYHPDSGLKFKDWQIPRWNELIKLTNKLHSLLPTHPYIGWDFTLTDNGWVLIEGDWGQFISEFADHEGIKNKFKSLLKNE